MTTSWSPRMLGGVTFGRERASAFATTWAGFLHAPLDPIGPPAMILRDTADRAATARQRHG